MKPWEKLLADIYIEATRGSRRYFVLPLVFVFIAVPGITGFVKSYTELFQFVSNTFSERVVHVDPEERELLEKDEWGLVIHSYESRELALAGRTKFTKDYVAAGHLNPDGQPIWINDILVVRDPNRYGAWILAIDMYRDDFASRQTLENGVREMLLSERIANVRGLPLQRWLSAAEPYKFNLKEFEKTWGRVANL